MSGMFDESQLYDPTLSGPAAWTLAGAFNPATHPIRHDGTSVYLSYLNASGTRVERVVIFGGWWWNSGGLREAWSSVEYIDNPEAHGAAWNSAPSMFIGRAFLNAVLLPNRSVLLIGGESGTGTSGTPVHYPEEYDPVALTHAPMAIHNRKRVYHSVGGLLWDGRVYVAGGTGQSPVTLVPEWHSVETFSPRYLFMGNVPVITTSPTSLGYASAFPITVTANGAPIGSIALIRLGSQTHHFDFDQRYVQLAFSPTPTPSTGSFTLTVQPPPSAGTAPPGMYFLFVVTTTGVPSLGVVVEVN